MEPRCDFKHVTSDPPLRLGCRKMGHGDDCGLSLSRTVPESLSVFCGEYTFQKDLIINSYTGDA